MVQVVDRYGMNYWHWYLSFGMWVSTVVGMLVIIATRLHYTIDVIVAAVLTIGMFRSYHQNAAMYAELQRFASMHASHPGNGGASGSSSPATSTSPILGAVSTDDGKATPFVPRPRLFSGFAPSFGA